MWRHALNLYKCYTPCIFLSWCYIVFSVNQMRKLEPRVASGQEVIPELGLNSNVYGLPWWLHGKESAYNAGDFGFHPWVIKFPWRRKWQLTAVFLPGESHGQRSLTGYGSLDHKESDTTESLTLSMYTLSLLLKFYLKSHILVFLWHRVNDFSFYFVGSPKSSNATVPPHWVLWLVFL